MNVTRTDFAARGGIRSQPGKRQIPSTNIFPKYQFDSDFRRPLVNLCPTSSSVSKTPVRARRGRCTSTSSALFSSSRRGSAGSTSAVQRTPGSSSTAVDCSTILAVTAGRGDARGEVGIAAVDLRCPVMILCQMSDCQTYPGTLTKIYYFDPVEILMPDTMCNSANVKNKLYSSIREKFPDLNVTPISRMHFNETEGLERVRTHCSPEYATIELFVKQKYYALAAAAALFKYVEYIQHLVYAPKSMRIEFQSSHNTTMIDIESAQSLELVASQSQNANVTLLGTLDRCMTPMGRKLLRASILQPLCQESLILERQTCVAELVSNHSLHSVIKPVVRRLYGADRLLTLSVQPVLTDNVQSAEHNLNYVLLLKTCLEILPELWSVLRIAKSPFFLKVYQKLENPQFRQMKEKILEVIHPEARSVMGHTSLNMQRCFAIKAGVNDLLDISRQAYCELIDEMKNLVENLAVKHKLPLSLGCNATLGYHIQAHLPRRSNVNVLDLPEEFIDVRKTRNTLTMTTNALFLLSHQCKIFCDDLHVMSNSLLNELLSNLRAYIGCLYELSADVAELDLVVSLAQISSNPEYVRPTFGPRLDLENSLHPIVDAFGVERPVPNDVRASVVHNFHTITGPNMSGKSFYLKQIVLLHIMAQIGCYVPATKAEFRIADRMFCRICFRDDLECHASTFVVEIKEMQYILQSITPRSLVILDELCRGTTVQEGSSIAMAICEELLQTSAFVFSATHFLHLTKLADMYPNVTNHCCETSITTRKGCNIPRLTYSYKLKPGVVSIEDYGIALAELSHLPKSVIAKARQFSAELPRSNEIRESAMTESELWEKICYDRVAQLYKLLEDNQFTRENIKSIIKDINTPVPTSPKNLQTCETFLNPNSSQFRNDAEERRLSSSQPKESSSKTSTATERPDWNQNEIFDGHVVSPCFPDDETERGLEEGNNLTFVVVEENLAKKKTESSVRPTLLFSPSDEAGNENPPVPRRTQNLFEVAGSQSFSRRSCDARSRVFELGPFLSPVNMEQDNKSDATQTVISPMFSPPDSPIFHEYLLTDEQLKPLFSGSSVEARISARKKEAEIFRVIEGESFDENEFYRTTEMPMMIDLSDTEEKN